MLIPSGQDHVGVGAPSLSRRVNANSQHAWDAYKAGHKLIKKGEC